MAKLKSMFDIIDICLEQWTGKDFGVEFGRVIVLIIDKDHHKIVMTVQNMLPLPRMIEGLTDDNFESQLNKLLTVLKADNKYHVIELYQSLYE